MKKGKRILALILSFAMVVSSLQTMGVKTSAAAEEPYVISMGRMVYSSSFKDNNFAENAVDGSYSSRWESEWKVDPQWFYVDLGKVAQITGVSIDWKGAYAKEYKIQFSDNEEDWTDVYTTTASKGGKENLQISGNARYVRIYMTKRANTAYGYSFNEFEVYGLDGVTKRPENYGENIALNKDATTSGLHITDSMYDEEGNLNDSSVRAANAVDGNATTKWVSDYNDNQWLCVDLGKSYEIGRIIINWTSDSGKVYDIQTSDDGSKWTTVYRQLSGYASELLNLPIYAKARYVRMYGYARVNTGNGFCINELEVYEYKTGDEKVSYDIANLPELEVKSGPEGKGSYVTSAMYLEKAKLPIYKTDDVKVPIATNDWWQSAIMQRFGNLLCIMPLKAKFSAKGLGVLTGTSGWLPTPSETAVNFSVKSETAIDFYVLPENFNATEAYDRVSGNSDYSATIDLCDDSGVLMSSTYVKGSPYLFVEFGKTETVYLSAPNLTKIFDDNGNEILTDKETITTDHIGVMVTDNDNKDKTYTSKSYYCLNFPQGTVLKNAGGKIRVTLPGKNGYMSVGTMPSEKEIKTFYQHGYAFVTDTKVTYEYNDLFAEIKSHYNVTTELKRSGFSNTTMQCMLPHQWKKSTDDDAAIATYTSTRGDMKCIVSNEFTTTDKFAGILPTFAMPTNEEFDTAKVQEYLGLLEGSTSKLTPSSDAYWEGKNVHPLAMGALMADQIGDTQLRDVFLERLKKILVNWFNYDGEDDKSFFIYDEHWGTLYYKQSEFGANTSIADHHFTYGYFMFGASVLSNYDKDFYNEYKGMVEMLARDYAGDTDDDEMFCKFRNYDMYEGHSWAGGYANNDSGNNQESASEALFSWAGMYLWGIVSQNNRYRDAGVFGFTNEIEAVKQYWFDYDGDNWISDWPYQVVSQVYGGTNFFGTFFGGQPLYCYGIQWLPVSEYLTYYGIEQKRCADIYQGLLDDTETAIQKSQLSTANKGQTEEEIAAIRDNYKTPDNGWQHITWSYLSMTDPLLAMDKFDNNAAKVQKGDQANTYWYINSMKESGHKTLDIYAVGNAASTVYYNEETGKYTAMVWNPTDEAQTITYKNASGELGQAKAGAHSLLKFEVPEEKGFQITQADTPYFNVKGFYDDSIDEKVSGKVTYDDNKYVEIQCDDKDSVVYYTTDGSTPTKASKVYNEPIIVSDNTVIKTFAVKEGCINSAYASLDITINGTEVTGGENIALNKEVKASTEEGKGTLVTGINDGDEKTRWSSKFTDDEWCYIDLGQNYPVNKVVINWQNSYGKKYEIQVSNDAQNWKTAAEVTCTSSGIKATEFDAVSARYVKMQGVERASVYGYSIWEMEVYAANVAEAPEVKVENVSSTKKKITMSTTVKGALIKYTTDGSEPNVNSENYTGAFELDSAKLIKAVTYRKGMMLSDVVTVPVMFDDSLLISESSIKVTEGLEKQLFAYMEGQSAENFVWTSDNSSIATVTKDGVVKGVSVGKTQVKVTCNGYTAVCQVEIVEPVHLTGIKLSAKELSLVIGDTTKLTVTYEPDDAVDDRTVTWSSSNDAIATVKDGAVTGVAQGSATITAKVGAFTATCEVSVFTAPPVKPSTPPGMIVKNPSANTITVTWGRVTGCLYDIYIDGVCVDPGTGCYTHTYNNISEGTHTIVIIAINTETGLKSDPATKVIEVLGEGVITTTPVETTTIKPVETTTVAPVETTTVAPIETTTVAPVETTTVAPVETTTVAPVETTTAKPVETTTAKPVETTTVKPIETTTVKPVETTTVKPVETTTSAQVETTAEPTSNAETTTAGSASMETTSADVETTTANEQSTKEVTTSNTKPTINPINVGKTKVKKAFKKKQWKKAKVSLKKLKGVTGYQIKISTSKKFKGKKVKTKNYKKNKFIIKKLKTNKRYYVKARAYRMVGKKKYYGDWTKVKKVRIKK